MRDTLPALADSHLACINFLLQCEDIVFSFPAERTVSMPAVAFSNNDIAIVAWTFDHHLDGCLGFAIHQIDLDANNKEAVGVLHRRCGRQGAPELRFWLSAAGGGTASSSGTASPKQPSDPAATPAPAAGTPAAAASEEERQEEVGAEARGQEAIAWAAVTPQTKTPPFAAGSSREARA
jgi:hypothetical protein